MGALSDHSECTLTNDFAKLISSFNTLHKLELFKVINMKSAFLSQRKLLSGLSFKVLSNRTFDLIIFLFCRSCTSHRWSWRLLLFWTGWLIFPLGRRFLDPYRIFHLLTWWQEHLNIFLIKLYVLCFVHLFYLIFLFLELSFVYLKLCSTSKMTSISMLSGCRYWLFLLLPVRWWIIYHLALSDFLYVGASYWAILMIIFVLMLILLILLLILFSSRASTCWFDSLIIRWGIQMLSSLSVVISY